MNSNSRSLDGQPGLLEPVAISVSRASDISSLGRTTIFNAIKDGKLKSRRIGGRRLILLADLKAFLSTHEQPREKSDA